MIVYYSKVSGGLPDARYEEFLSRLPLPLQDKNRRYRNRQDKWLNLFGKLLLVEALKEFNLDLGLYYDQYGRPYVSDIVDFNISHSGEYVICGAAQGVRVGLDIEIIKPLDFQGFENTMSADEWKDITASGDPLKAFFRNWVIKESVIKADSRGLNISLQDIIIDTDRASGSVFASGSAECLGKRWYLKELALDEGYCACLATDSAVEEVELREMVFE